MLNSLAIIISMFNNFYATEFDLGGICLTALFDNEGH